MQKKKLILITSITACVLILIGGFLVWKFNRYYLELSVSGKTIDVEYGLDEIPKITALRKGTLINRKGTPIKTTLKGEVDYKTLGTYKVTFTANYKELTLVEKRVIRVVDTTAPKITLMKKENHYANPAIGYEEEGYKAIDNHDGDLTDKVERTEKDGMVIYTVKDSSGNKAKVKRKLVYKDVIAPVITLNQGKSISINIGKDFADPGFTAADECDGDLTSKVEVTGTVDGHKYGTYQLTYYVKDSSGNETTVKRAVKVADISAPVITLHGEKSCYIKVGTQYSDPGFAAHDNIDGDMTTKVSVTGGVDTSRMGRNSIVYSVTDAYGNKTTVERVIYVYEKQAVANPINPGNKVVYLTFDDGPSAHTARLLDILDKYGVKATFFVTNQFPKYQYMIGETYRRGHTIALHTYSHNYASVYANEDAYYRDLSMIRDICVAQTGQIPTIVRFPGGTSNTVSRKHCRGIMTALTQSISYHGYLYCDWNVSSGDAGGAKTRSAVYNNVISGIRKHSVSIVLQHDITSHSVSAVEDILFWGIQNGYTFLPMSETTPMVRFKPQN